MYKSIPLNFMFFKAPLLKRILGYVGIIYIDYRTDEKRPIYYGDRILALKYNIQIKFENICMYNNENAYDILFGYIKKENMSVFQLAMSELFDVLNSHQIENYPTYEKTCCTFLEMMNPNRIKEIIRNGK